MVDAVSSDGTRGLTKSESDVLEEPTKKVIAPQGGPEEAYLGLHRRFESYPGGATFEAVGFAPEDDDQYTIDLNATRDVPEAPLTSLTDADNRAGGEAIWLRNSKSITSTDVNFAIDTLVQAAPFLNEEAPLYGIPDLLQLLTDQLGSARVAELYSARVNDRDFDAGLETSRRAAQAIDTNGEPIFRDANSFAFNAMWQERGFAAAIGDWWSPGSQAMSNETPKPLVERAAAWLNIAPPPSAMGVNFANREERGEFVRQYGAYHYDIARRWGTGAMIGHTLSRPTVLAWSQRSLPSPPAMPAAGGMGAAERTLPPAVDLPAGGLSSASAWTKAGRYRAAGSGIGLPNQEGYLRYVPPKNWSAERALPRGKAGGYLDRHGNEWVPDLVKGEWDVQLGRTGQRQLGYLSKNGRYLNVTPDGRISH